MAAILIGNWWALRCAAFAAILFAIVASLAGDYRVVLVLCSGPAFVDGVFAWSPVARGAPSAVRPS